MFRLCCIVLVVCLGGCFGDWETDKPDISITEPNLVENSNASNSIQRVTFDESMLTVDEHCNLKMDLFSKSSFEINGEPATIELYVFGYVFEEGRPIMPVDDNNVWSLLLRQGDYAYPLIVNKRVQNGNIRYYLGVDNHEPSINLLAIISQGAGLNVYEYKYNYLTSTFAERELYKMSGVGMSIYNTNDWLFWD